MTTTAALVRASHPEPAVAVVAIASALAAGVGAPVATVAAAFAAGQLATGWSNDWIDRERDLRTGRVDKPLVQGRLSPRVLGLAAGTAAAACVPLSLALGLRAGTAHLVAVASALSYNAWLKRGPWSWLPYAVSFGLVPHVVALAGPDGTGATWWATAAGALLGVGAHLANALPDLEDDVATGVRGLPHRLGRPLSTVLMAGLLLVATGLLAYGPGGASATAHAALALAAALTALAVALARRPGSRAAFLAAVAVAVLDVGLLVARGAALSAG